MTGVLFVSNQLEPTSVGGREQLSALVCEALASLYGNDFDQFVLAAPAQRSVAERVSGLFGHIDGVNSDTIAKLLTEIERLGVDRVLLNGSNLGVVAREVRAAFPRVQVVTFFHNCEARFFLGALRQKPTIRALAVLFANYLAERNAVRNSDIRICLNARDGALLWRVYGRGATHFLPMALTDRLPKAPSVDLPAAGGKFALFVGGTFYANRQGIEWFVDHVAASAPIRTVVVGKGFEQWKAVLERNGNVEVIGAVDSVVPWYLGARFVIAPIFDGSGMKTKVAEALMFGKRIVGTSEAFAGYEDVVSEVGALCETPAEFLVAMQEEMRREHEAVDPKLRGIYVRKYSFAAAREQLSRILGVAINA